MTGRSRLEPRGKRTEASTPDGIEIISREHNTLVSHPHPRFKGKLVPTNGINKILLADERVMYECDFDGWYRDSALSVRAHLVSHGTTFTDPDYSIEILRKVIRTANKYKKERVHNYAQKTADELNTLNVPTVTGASWTPGNVSSLYARWRDDDRVKITRTPRQDTPTTSATTAALATEVMGKRPGSRTRKTADDVTFSTQLLRLSDQLQLAAATAAKLSRDIAKLPVAVHDLEELRDKAERYDQLAATLGQFAQPKRR